MRLQLCLLFLLVIGCQPAAQNDSTDVAESAVAKPPSSAAATSEPIESGEVGSEAAATEPVAQPPMVAPHDSQSDTNASDENGKSATPDNDSTQLADPKPADSGAAAATVQPNQDLRILAWNIESNGANPDVIADQLKQMPSYDIYGFTEVRPAGFPAIKSALGNQYYCVYTQSGEDDRMAFAIRKDRFEVIDSYEFPAYQDYVINPGNYRSPFVFELLDQSTGRQFLLVINHLARGKAEVRQNQARAIRQWAKDRGKPIIAIGDYNFDYVFDTDKGNPAMDIFLAEDVFQWVRPVPMVDSNYYDEDQDGVDDYIDSLLDFAFVAGEAKNWKAECQVIVRDGDFPDNDQTSDHRPVQLIIHP